MTKTGEQEGKHLKQSGGRGHYGHCKIRLEPAAKGAGFNFVDEVVGGRIPQNFIPSVEKGVIKAMVSGPFAGYPVVDVTVSLYDGSYHDVDSSDIAFQEAGRMAFKEGFLKASPHLLEPIMDVEVVTPEEFMGGCTGSIAQRRGRIETMDSKGNQKIIRAKGPLSERFGYASPLRTVTHVLGAFSMIAMNAAVTKNIRPFGKFIPGRPLSVNTYALKKFGLLERAAEVEAYVLSGATPTAAPIREITDEFQRLHEASGRELYGAAR